MKNVVLVQPHVGDWDSMRSQPIPPMSLLSAATLCEKEYEIRWVDQRLNKDWKKDLYSLINADTLCVGTTSYTGPMIAHSLEISEFVKGISRVPVVWGGVHASLLPEETLRDPSVDIVVQGEAEVTFLELARALSEGKDIQSLAGAWCKNRGRITPCSQRSFLDLDALPPLPYHIVPMNQYMPLYQGERTFYYQSSRGCPYPCSYCYNSVFNQRVWRARSADYVLSDLRRIVRDYAPEHLYIIDDIFFVDKNRSLKIIQGIKDMGISWDLQGVDLLSIQSMDKEYIRFLEDAGCTRMSIGIESGSEKVRKLMKKRPYDPKDIRRIFQKFESSHITLYCNYIAGTPEETDRDLKMTIDLIFNMMEKNSHIKNFPIYRYIPYPGTEMFDRAIKNGYVPPRSLKEWSMMEWGQIRGHSQENYFGAERHPAKFYHSLFFVSLFIDSKLKEYTVPWPIRALTAFYRPLARFRLKHLYFRFLPERYLALIVSFVWIILRNIWKSLRRITFPVSC